jgi:hypothetical protein
LSEKAGDGLATAVKRHFPTPTAADAERSSEEYPRGNPTLLGSVNHWPTPTATDGKRGGEMTENMTGQSLPQVVNTVEKWPTPRESDATRGPDYARSSREGSGGDDCTTVVCKEEGNSGRLNPEWTAWLMGFPTGWTVLEDSETL